MGGPFHRGVQHVDGLMELGVLDELGDALVNAQRLFHGQRWLPGRRDPGGGRCGAGS
jgi:hypothetical protein